MPQAKTYKIRRFINGKNSKGEPFVNYSLTIPSPIALRLPRSMQFACELTDEGILFRPMSPEEEALALPEWATGEADPDGNGEVPDEAPEASEEAEEGDSGAATEPEASAPRRRRRPTRSKPETVAS